MEKGPQVTSAPVEGNPQSPVVEKNESPSKWRPGYLKNLPFYALLYLTGVVLCACAAIAVLVASNGKSSVAWGTHIAPNVALSIINSAANLLLALAITEGIAIAWWRKTLHGATVEELHRSYEFTTRTKIILLNIFRLDRIAFAALATKLAIVDSILLQRATTTYVAQDIPRSVSLNGVAATEFPTTGFVVSEGSFGAQKTCDCYMIGDTYGLVVNNWESSNGFFKGSQALFPNCNGVCYSFVEAIGFEIDCQKTTVHTDLAADPIAAFNAEHGSSANSSQWTNIPIFNSSFGLSYPDTSTNYSRMTLDLNYYQSDNPSNPSSSSCPGTYTTILCSLRPAIVNYPIKITNYDNVHVVNGVSLGTKEDAGSSLPTSTSVITPYSYSQKQAEGFEIVRYLYPNESQSLNSTSSLGGIANALSQFLSSTASITYTGGALWALRQQGTLAQTMMFGPPNMGSCDCSFRDDSLSTIVAAINQLSFLTATEMVDRSSYNKTGLGVGPGTPAVVFGVTDDTTINTTWTQLQNTVQIADVPYYRTNFVFMGLGVATMMACVLLVIPTFWGYGQIGRKVTMGPMEIAHAFGSPILARNKEGQIVTKHDVEGVIEEVGDRRVRYGFVEEDAQQYSDGLTMMQDSGHPASPIVQQSVSPVTQATSTATSPQVSSPTSATTKLNRKSTVILRMDEPDRVSPLVGPTSPVVSSDANPKSPLGRGNKMWS